ncbi:MAG TPA: pantoate--beta-alanine ligase [Terriglobales bacterium]
MRIVTTVAETRAAARQLKASGKKLGLVPTMGALHEGHLSLVRLAKQQCDAVAVSIFVNPTQFGVNEDFSKYPRTFERDRQMLEAEKIDLLFAPAAEEMYPAGAATFVTVEGMSERLDGRSRPGHFRGVTTVVCKLFSIVEPDTAFFGQKDAAQVAIIKRMVRDMNMAVEIAVGPIVREADGLAMSSRNAYLDARQRRQATVLSRALKKVGALVAQGQTNSAMLIEGARQVFSEEPEVRVDYIEIVNPETLEPVKDVGHVGRGSLLAVAAYVGSTRLIDNRILSADR